MSSRYMKGRIQMNKTVEPAQAEKWLQTLKDRTASITGFEAEGTVAGIVQQVDADFPNQIFKLVDSRTGQWIGMRRVFIIDRSHADTMFEHHAIGKIITGTMSEGMLGEAQNGRIITNLH